MITNDIKPVSSSFETDQTPFSCINYEISIIKMFGLFPVYGQPLNEYPRLYYLKFAINLIITATFFTSIWLNVFFNFDNSAEVIETLYFGLTETTFVSKLINIHVRFDRFNHLIPYLKHPSFTQYKPSQQKYISDAIRIVRRFAILFRGCISITIIFFIVFPFLDKRLLVVPSYFPISVEKYHYWCYVYQLWGIIVNGYAHSSLDCIVTGCIKIGSAQFEILKENLIELGKDMQLDIPFEERTKCEDIALAKLRTYVEHHVIIIKYAYDIESMFSFVQFVQFLASSIIICVTGFQIIVTPITDLKFMTLVFYFSCSFIQVLMCCWFGHDIMTQSESVGEACYMSHWYKYGHRVARTIFIIMERAKRPVTLTAGKFFDLTLQTLMQVLKTSYSYLALLRRMNEVERL